MRPPKKRTQVDRNGEDAFSLLICLDATKFVLLDFFTLIKTIYLKIWTKPLPKNAKSPLPVDMLLLKASLLKLPKKRAEAPLESINLALSLR